jgi:hypothetical protein
MASKTKKPVSSGTKPGASAPGSTAGTTGSAPKTRTERRAEQFQQRRIDRRKAPEKKRRERMLVRGFLIGLATVLAVAVVASVVIYFRDQDDAVKPEGVVSYNYTDRSHTNDPVTYEESPPVGGPHNPVWQNCGYYDGKVANQNAVHSLEHGAVWITYRSDVSQADRDKLKSMAEDEDYLLVSEYDDQQSPLVATAWNNQLPISSIDDEKLQQFINYFMQGPQTPERGALCSGGIDTTVG